MATAKQKPLPPVDDSWEEVGDPYAETVDLTEEGPMVGIYLGAKEIETTDPQGNPRPSLLHDFQVGEEHFGIWGSFDLDRKLSPELVGKPVRVEYLKTINVKGGKQTMKVFRVQSKK